MEELYYAFEITPFIENFENKHFYIVISRINVYALKIFLIKMYVWIKFLLDSIFFFSSQMNSYNLHSEKNIQM